MSELKPMTAHRAIYFMERFKKEEKLLGPNEQAAVDYVIAMLEAQDALPTQAGHVPEASCGECGKKASDGWALYCVACMEKAGLPAVTDSPPLMHSCTSSLGKTPDSTAQAGKVLTDDRLLAMWEGTDGERALRPTLGKNKILSFARAIEQAVLAKRASMTDDTALIRQLAVALDRCRFDSLNMSVADMRALSEARTAASKRLGIGGEKGGA